MGACHINVRNIYLDAYPGVGACLGDYGKSDFKWSIINTATSPFRDQCKSKCSTDHRPVLKKLLLSLLSYKVMRMHKVTLHAV